MWSALVGQTASGMGAPSSATSSATGGVSHIGGMQVGAYGAAAQSPAVWVGLGLAAVALVVLFARR